MSGPTFLTADGLAPQADIVKAFQDQTALQHSYPDSTGDNSNELEGEDPTLNGTPEPILPSSRFSDWSSVHSHETIAFRARALRLIKERWSNSEMTLTSRLSFRRLSTDPINAASEKYHSPVPGSKSNITRCSFVPTRGSWKGFATFRLVPFSKRSRDSQLKPSCKAKYSTAQPPVADLGQLDSIHPAQPKTNAPICISGPIFVSDRESAKAPALNFASTCCPSSARGPTRNTTPLADHLKDLNARPLIPCSEEASARATRNCPLRVLFPRSFFTTKTRKSTSKVSLRISPSSPTDYERGLRRALNRGDLAIVPANQACFDKKNLETKQGTAVPCSHWSTGVISDLDNVVDRSSIPFPLYRNHLLDPPAPPPRPARRGSPVVVEAPTFLRHENGSKFSEDLEGAPPVSRMIQIPARRSSLPSPHPRVVIAPQPQKKTVAAHRHQFCPDEICLEDTPWGLLQRVAIETLEAESRRLALLSSSSSVPVSAYSQTSSTSIQSINREQAEKLDLANFNFPVPEGKHTFGSGEVVVRRRRSQRSRSRSGSNQRGSTPTSSWRNSQSTSYHLGNDLDDTSSTLLGSSDGSDCTITPARLARLARTAGGKDMESKWW